MKIRFSHRNFLLFIFLFAFASIAAAQEKPKALKFDEFDEAAENAFYSERGELTFGQRVERFSKQIEKERGVSAYVIYYQARISYANSGWWSFVDRVERIKYQINYNDRTKVKDVVIVNGGYREKNSVEFWIVPENAELPAPKSTFDESEIFVCPTISIYNDTPPGNTEAINFVAPAHNFKGIENYSLKWRVSAGEIVEGQGMNFIKVKVKDSAAKRVTAYLEVSGLPFPCPRVFSTTVEVNGKLSLVDSFGIVSNGDLKSRLDSFLVSLQNNPMAKGYIVIYGGRIDGNRDVARRDMVIRTHLRFRNFDMSRIIFVRGGFRETVSTELWLAFDEAVPVLTPTVDEKFVLVPKPKTKPRARKK